jgi:hypothetical protein
MAITITMLSSANCFAGSLERLLMPGPVIEGHKKLEESCNQCHQPLGNTPQKTLCLDCHEEIKSDVTASEGLHGKDDITSADCKTCHTDHKGRDAKIIFLDMQEFNHDQTDFSLNKSHTQVECSSCHLSDKKFREADHDCIDCHKNDDIHKTELGNDCNDCHSEASWTKTNFDHKKTNFALKNKHKETTCLSCHVTTTYTDAPTRCYDCHQVNDVHANLFGKECGDCHNESGWDSIDFDHAKTDYPLTGEHKEASCYGCHKSNAFDKELSSDCSNCHRTDDPHNSRNGDQCDSCHTTRNWKNKFDHDRKTDFPLAGQHEELACTTCHKGDLYKDELPTECVGCHKNDDVHQQSQGKECANCHNEKEWLGRVLFDHDVTHFPLTGLHATVSCDDCHASTNFKEASSKCINCHKEGDVHKKALGEDCQQCHTPSSWDLWQFDHDKATNYELTGKHSGLECEACHTKPAQQGELDTSTECSSCHHSEDIHFGRFGRACDSCHDTESFEHFTLPQ